MAYAGPALSSQALTAAPRRALRRRLVALVSCTLLAVVAFVAQAQAATYQVGITSDGTGTCSVPSSGKCSLRQLINFENGLTTVPSPPDTIVVPAGSYTLTNGPLVVQESVTISGAGARTTALQQGTTAETARVFDIVGNPKVNSNPTVVISGVTIAFGKADSSNGFFGGNIRNQANLTLSEDFIEGGQTIAGSGAGISNDGGTLTLTHSLVWDNGGGNDSGGIQNYGDDSVGAGTLTIDNSTIANNSSSLGGGVFSWCNGSNGECSPNNTANNTTTITNSTIAFNNGGTRSTTGGGLLATQGTISVRNSIVASNTVTNPLSGAQMPSNCGAGSPGAITSLGDNLESAADCGFTTSGDLQKTNPGFLTGGVRFNGGNTGTLALSATSAAVDAGPSAAQGCSGTDQRDVARPQGTACDIGAYELFQPVEGQQFTTVVGQISAGGSGPTIDWGDGTAASQGTLDSLQQVTGTHTYVEEGVYDATINWKDAKGSNQQTPFDVKVVDAPLTATPVSITATTGVAFNGAVATFTDANPNGTVSDFSATIDWGDGTASAGSIATNPAGGFVVNGTHTYTTVNSFKTTITISDVGGAQAVAHGAARVTPPPPTVSSVSPSAGPTAGATSVTITGTNLTAASAVKFGTTNATSFTVNNATQITATAPAKTAGTVDITVTTAGGTSATGTADQYTYVAPPTVTNVSPSAGPTAGATSVTITGTNLTAASAVKFGTTNATSFTVNNATQITATAPAKTAGTVDITVTTTGGTSSTSAADQYTYQAPPSASITAPADNQTYNLNQSVPTTFSCTEGPSGPGIQTCTDSNGVTGGVGALDTSTTGAHTYTVTATSKDTQSASKTIHYTVVGPPTATITTPANNQTYNLNQSVSTGFSCTEAAGGPGIASCVDSGGASGGAGTLDTSIGGVHSYTVTARSQDGQTGGKTIQYTVTGAPTATITTPADNQVYNLGQPVATSFSCADAANGPGIATCADSNGKSGSTGVITGSLDTSTVGLQKSYTVTSTSQDGQKGTTTIHYTVVGPPTAAISAPADNQAYNQGQNVPTAFSCTEAVNGLGIKTCMDSGGADGGAGKLDTSTAGAHTYTVTATSKGGQTASRSIHYAVIGPPIAAISAPPDNQTFTLGQSVPTAFSCTEAPGGQGINGCSDSNGSTSGTGALDTSTAGAHTYTVTATSKDGQSATATIHYSVAPAVPPAVTGGAPTSRKIDGAALAGTVNPEGTPTQAFFQYGLDLSQRGPGASTTLYDQSTPPQQIGTDTSDHSVTAPLTGLIPGGLYHVRLVAINGAGTTFGPDQTFTTARAAAPPPPVLGQTENATPVSGTVFIQSPNGQFIPLTGAVQVHSGAVIDALHGSLRLTAAVGKGKGKKTKTEQGTFGGAVFRLTQARTGLTTLRLLENAFKGGPSFALCTAHKAADPTATAASSKTLQLLKASAHGKFSTKGRYSAATVRGTKWTVADRCDGTLTHVITDSVAVTDFVRHKTIILHAGQSYLAKARKP